MGCTLLVALVVLSVAGPALVPYDATRTDLAFTWAPPSPEHWLGCDALGRDVLARLLVAARVSFVVAVAATGLATVLGTCIGVAAAHLGGWVDALLTHMVDLALGFPKLILAVLAAAALGAGLLSLVLALGLAGAPPVARVVRAAVVDIEREGYVRAAVAAGASSGHVVRWHVLPALRAVVLVRAAMMVADVIVVEAGLSFLGFGVQEPLPSWGLMIRDGIAVLQTAPAMALAASSAVFLAAVAFNLVVDGLRDPSEAGTPTWLARRWPPSVG